MGISAIISEAAPIVSGILAGRGAERAAETARADTAQATAQGIEAQERALEQLRTDLSPFVQFGTGALGPLSGALGITPSAPGVTLPRTQVSGFQGPSAVGDGGTAQDIATGVATLGAATGNPILQAITIADQLTFDPNYSRFASGVFGGDPAVWDFGVPRESDLAAVAFALGEDPTDPTRSTNDFNVFVQRGRELIEQGRLIVGEDGGLSMVNEDGSLTRPQATGQGQFSMVTVAEAPQPASQNAPGQVPGSQVVPLETQLQAQQIQAQPFQSRADQIGGEGNPLLQQAIQARQGEQQLNPLLQQAVQARQADRGLNPLLQQAVTSRQESRAGDILTPELLQNPLLQALQDDVTRRLLANQAARGRLGSGGTAEELQRRLVPQAIQFGLAQEDLRERELAAQTGLGLGLEQLRESQLASQAGLGLNIEQLRENQLASQAGLGLGLEDLRQREIDNLFRATGIGQASAARTGAAGQTAAGNIGNLATAGAAAQTPLTLGAAQARNAQIGSLAAGVPGLFNLFNSNPVGDATGLNRPAIGGQSLAGPFQATGTF